MPLPERIIPLPSSGSLEAYRVCMLWCSEAVPTAGGGLDLLRIYSFHSRMFDLSGGDSARRCYCWTLYVVGTDSRVFKSFYPVSGRVALSDNIKSRGMQILCDFSYTFNKQPATSMLSLIIELEKTFRLQVGRAIQNERCEGDYSPVDQELWCLAKASQLTNELVASLQIRCVYVVDGVSFICRVLYTGRNEV
jgi:hypothetical protein